MRRLTKLAATALLLAVPAIAQQTMTADPTHATPQSQPQPESAASITGKANMAPKPKKAQKKAAKPASAMDTGTTAPTVPTHATPQSEPMK